MLSGAIGLTLCSGLGGKWVCCLGEPITAKSKGLIGRLLCVSAFVVVGTGGVIETIVSGSNCLMLLANSSNFTSNFFKGL